MENKQVDDRDIRQQLWAGVVPVVFNMLPREIASLSYPLPYYAMISRQSYFPILVDEVKKHFEPFAAGFGKGTENENVWFEFEDVPLRWHLPAGVLFDQFVMKKLSQGQELEIPWKITVHLSNFPAEQIVKLGSEKEVQWNFTNTLKESMYMKFGTTKTLLESNLSLWNSIKESRMFDFEKDRQQLESSNNVPLPIKTYPFRLYTDKEFTEQRIPTLHSVPKEEAEQKTIAQVIFDALPQLSKEKQPVCIVQGVRPSPDTPFKWLAENCSHPDGFLYITLL